jgi:flagellar basal-body rod modification protein FlgD
VIASGITPELAMTIAVSSSTASATTYAASSSSSSISTTDFLQLLVTELENQNPLDPTDTSDFMSQMMSYANYSQQQDLNTQLSSMLSSFNSLLSTSAVGYLGHTVEAKGDTTTLTNGQATWGYSLNSAASSVTITIKDSSGATVWSGDGETEAGTHSFSWNGVTSDGTQLADGGDYTIEITATDAAGKSVYGYTTIAGTVTGIDSSSGTTTLKVGNTSVTFDDVVGVRS